MASARYWLYFISVLKLGRVTSVSLRHSICIRLRACEGWGWAEFFVALFSGYIARLISDLSVSSLQIFVCAVVLLTSLFVYIAYTIGIPYWRERSPPTLVVLFIVGHWILINVVFHYYYALTTSAGHPPQVIAVHSSPVIVLKATVICWLSWHVIAAPVLLMYWCLMDGDSLRPAPHGCVFHALRSHDASTYMQGRIVTDRDATHEKRVRVGRG